MRPKLKRFYFGGQLVTETFINRFWKKVRKDRPDRCWLWTGSALKSGYGQIGTREHGQNMLAHRVSWIIHFGPIHHGLFVLHKCDNPPCVNPAHLWLGTCKDNMQDSLAKGRNIMQRHPERASRKLTNEQVRQIRNEYVPYRMTIPILQSKFGVAKNTIGAVIYGNSWKHLKGKAIKPRHQGHKLTVGQVVEIRSKYKSGKTSQRQIARLFGISRSMVQWIVHEKAWRRLL